MQIIIEGANGIDWFADLYDGVLTLDGYKSINQPYPTGWPVDYIGVPEASSPEFDGLPVRRVLWNSLEAQCGLTKGSLLSVISECEDTGVVFRDKVSAGLRDYYGPSLWDNVFCHRVSGLRAGE